MDLNAYAKRVHKLNAKWWYDLNTGEPLQRNRGELKMLIVSELAEAMEGERKNLQDDKLPHRKMAEVEMADTAIRLLDFAGGLDIEIEQLEDSTIESMEMETPPENKGEFLFAIVASLVVKPYGDELALALSFYMIEKYCKKHGYDLWAAVEEKLKYNETRIDHTNEARKAANGKKF